ncbi:MAG TPA: UdgX family uracil-DNA binding protein [Mycobacteriales bacterium]|nr:phage polymerase-related protein [Cryptosporangiaceae bacterium]MDQ1679102.1 uracil-DNA glycosylase [Actinomycetota bacterium]HEV7756436.1 UdgX family uracil-DNA binding protein [Mycobacteriales bacterium]
MDARQHLPRSADLSTLAEAVRTCTACELHENGTRAVFGEGRPDARLVLVGEQPGDVEEREGHPFVGPAGKLLNRAMQDAGLDREHAYVTNAVKHFRFTRGSGPRRIHATPEVRHIEACRPWLNAELALLNPEVVVVLGATAVRALLGNAYRVTRDRGKLLPFEVPTNGEDAAVHTTHALITTHPSAVLRTPPDRKEEAYQALVHDLTVAAKALA